MEKLDFATYAERAGSTALYANRGANLMYPVLGLCGETGEVAEKVKKMLRDDAGVLTDERRELLIGEVGDVLWYIAAIAHELGVSMEEIATRNLAKLASRKERGVLHGNGDTR